MALLGGLLKLGGSILLGDRKRRQDQRDQINNLPRLRESAEKAGFNPLTALLASGGGGFGMTTGAAPLASQDALFGLIDGVEDRQQEKNEKAAKEAADKIAVIRKEAEDASGVATIARRTSQAASIPARVPVLGKQSVTSAPVTAQRPKMSGVWEKTEDRPRESVPLTAEYRTGMQGGTRYTGLNPDAFEIGVGEIIGGAIVHGGAAVANSYTEFRDRQVRKHQDEKGDKKRLQQHDANSPLTPTVNSNVYQDPVTGVWLPTAN